MTKREKNLIERNLDLIFEFEKYVLEHPNVAKKIPRNAVVSMRIKGDTTFNRWSQRLASKQAKNKRPVLCVTIKKLRPPLSRIEKLHVEQAA